VRASRTYNRRDAYFMTKTIASLFSKVAEDLWRSLPPAQRGRQGLVFPRYRTGKLCVSEKKPASHLFGHHAANISEISYAPEVPTKGQHFGFGKHKRSSLSDWRLFDAPTGEERANIEFKSGTGRDVASDIRKIVGEGLEGAWFCTLKKGNEKAFDRVFEGLRKALENVLAKNDTGSAPALTLAICALEPRELIWRSFKPGELTVELASAEFAGGKWKLDLWEKKYPDDLTRGESARIESRTRRSPGS
jgi:hypothetical protein